MAGFITRGQPAAVRQISAMIAAGLPHALLLVGPRSVGKTTLALDIAAAQLCAVEDPAHRPCRACRSCRLVDAGNHPDVHRMAPDGPGAAIGIDAVRSLISDLSLLSVEGGPRLAIIESAHRMTDDAQNAILKTLEEPPAGVTLVLCADDEDRLLPTIQSRVARVRLGTLAPREIEHLLEARGDADAPTANRLARLAGGRPGLAVAYAQAPDAVVIRSELARSLIDLAAVSRAIRLVRIRELLARAQELAVALTPSPGGEPTGGRAPKRRGRAGAVAPAARVASTAGDERAAESSADPDLEVPVAGGPKAPPAERRRGAAALLEIWRAVARDIALVELGEATMLHDPDLLEDVRGIAGRLRAGAAWAFLVRLDRAGRLLDGNANPELLLDVLVLAWPAEVRAA